MTDLLDLFDIQNLCIITRELLAPGYLLLIQVRKTVNEPKKAPVQKQEIVSFT